MGFYSVINTLLDGGYPLPAMPFDARMRWPIYTIPPPRQINSAGDKTASIHSPRKHCHPRLV